MDKSSLIEQITINIFGLSISESIITSLGITLFLATICWLSTRKLSTKPSNYQTILEAIYQVMYNAVADILPEQSEIIFPFVATLWIFILIANLMGIIPGLNSPTNDLSVTASLAIVTFLSVHWFGLRIEGVKKYLKHYISPNPLLLPFHLISEISRTLALAVRLFGNMMSLQLTALIILMVAGFLAPIPILMLHLIEAVIQAYIFGMLALIYIAGGIHTQTLRREKENHDD